MPQEVQVVQEDADVLGASTAKHRVGVVEATELKPDEVFHPPVSLEDFSAAFLKLGSVHLLLSPEQIQTGHRAIAAWERMTTHDSSLHSDLGQEGGDRLVSDARTTDELEQPVSAGIQLWLAAQTVMRAGVALTVTQLERLRVLSDSADSKEYNKNWDNRTIIDFFPGEKEQASWAWLNRGALHNNAVMYQGNIVLLQDLRRSESSPPAEPEALVFIRNGEEIWVSVSELSPSVSRRTRQ